MTKNENDPADDTKKNRWTTQKTFHALNFLCATCRALVFAFRDALDAYVAGTKEKDFKDFSYAAAARSVVRDWDHARVYAESANATCAFYGAETCGSDQYRLKLHFAYQWEAVARCHAALERSPLFESIELVVRARPDVVLLQDLALAEAAATMARARAPALVPCVVGQKMYIDDFVIATKRAMAEYVKAEGAFDLVPGCCEKLVWFRLSPLGPVIKRVGHAIVCVESSSRPPCHRRRGDAGSPQLESGAPDTG